MLQNIFSKPFLVIITQSSSFFFPSNWCVKQNFLLY